MDYDIFIDESCHLEHDSFPVMAIGYIKVAKPDYLVITSFNIDDDWSRRKHEKRYLQYQRSVK